MRKSSMVVLLPLLGLTGCGTHGELGRAAREATVADVTHRVSGIVVTEADDGATVTLAIDQRLTLLLLSDRSDGYRWRLGRLDGESVGRIGPVAYGEDSVAPAQSDSGDSESWTFTGNATGIGPLVMEYARSGEDEPARTFTVTIEVL